MRARAWASPACHPAGAAPSLITPSSAGALSPTTSITGQLEVRGERGLVRVWPGRIPLSRDPSMTCWCDSYRSVLALGTVPGRLMSRSLRLMEEKEGQCEPTGRCHHQCHSTRIRPLPASRSSTQPCCPSTLCMEDAMATSAMAQAEPVPRDAAPIRVAGLPTPCMHGTASLPPFPGLCQHPVQEETRQCVPMAVGSGTRQGSGTGTTTPSCPASSGRQLCTAACVHWRVMTAPSRGLGSHSDLRATHQHCSPSPWHRQGRSPAAGLPGALTCCTC